MFKDSITSGTGTEAHLSNLSDLAHPQEKCVMVCAFGLPRSCQQLRRKILFDVL